MHALQIEINRALYLDEERVERGCVLFAKFAVAWASRSRDLIGLYRFPLRARALPLAAE